MNVRVCVPGLLLGLSLTARAAGPKVDELWDMYCATCHGRDMEGGSAGALNDGVWRHGGADADLTRVIREGVNEEGMPGWGNLLKPAQVRALVVYIREKETEASRAAAPAPKPDSNAVVRTRHAAFRLETLAELPGTPWALAFPPDGRMLVTVKDGRLLVLDAAGKIQGLPVAGLPPVTEFGQGGLMDVAVHPDFKNNGWVYLTYTDGAMVNGKPVGMTALARGRIKDGRWTDGAVLWRAAAGFRTSNGVHFGSRIAFDGKGCVVFTVGERGRNFDAGAQDPMTPYGKIFRLKDDGGIPEDNPKITGGLPGLYSYGHRNPQGLAVDPRNGDLLSTEHGPRGGDELNRIKPGKNYGWPVVTHGMNYDGTPWGTGETSRPGMEPAVTQWTPSLAVCGLAFATGDAFPAWRNDLFVGALAGQEVRRVRFSGDSVSEQETLFRGLGRVRDVRCGPDGRLYVIFNQPGRLVRLNPVTGPEAGVAK